MKVKNTIAPSRIGKKQVITYVDPDLAEKVRTVAHSDGKTIQEMLADAMNVVCIENNREPIFEIGHNRIVKRNKNLSKPRTQDNTLAKTRIGKKPIGGWFEMEKVQEALDFSNEIKIPMQTILESGLRKILENR